jgi:hypothetical protein
MALAGSDPGLKARTMESMQRYRESMNAYVAARKKETGAADGFRISFDSRSGFSFSAPREKGTLDLAGFPVYDPSLAAAFDPDASAVIHGGVLVIATFLAFSGAVAAFHRFDLR